MNPYETVKEARENLGRYFKFYNTERLHESLGYRTSEEIYLGWSNSINEQAGEIHLKHQFFVLTLVSTLVKGLEDSGLILRLSQSIEKGKVISLKQ